jgi:hypothetical protein
VPKDLTEEMELKMDTELEEAHLPILLQEAEVMEEMEEMEAALLMDHIHSLPILVLEEAELLSGRVQLEVQEEER